MSVKIIIEDDTDSPIYNFSLQIIDQTANNEGMNIRFCDGNTSFTYEEGLQIAIELAKYCIPRIIPTGNI